MSVAHQCPQSQAADAAQSGFVSAAGRRFCSVFIWPWLSFPSYMKLLSEDDLDERDEACDEFELMSHEEQQAWIDQVLSSYPKIDELPDLDSYNDIH